jgi:sugar phosphate isomerase/epimerase
MNRRDLFKTLPAFALPALAADEERQSAKARFRTALCAYSFRQDLGAKKLNYADLVRMAVDMNLDGLDLTVYWFPNTTDHFLLPLRGLAYRMGVEIYSISIRTNMCQPTVELQQREAAEVSKWVDVASKLGAGHIRVFGGTVPKESTPEQAAGWVVEVLKRSSDYAATKGVILGLENHGGITEKAETIIGIVSKVKSPWVGVNLDTGNFRTNVFPQIEQLAKFAVNVQVKADMSEDGVRKPSDWDRILGVLARAGYKGYLALEYEAKEDPNTAVPRLMKKLRQISQKYNNA